MERLLIVAFAGFMASLIDGALGMGFGPTSSTILLGAGLAPAAVSTMVNIAKVATGLAAGGAHWKFGNIDKRIVMQLAIPGVVGSVVGVTVLANVDGDALRPYLAVMLFAVGVRILWRYSRVTSNEASFDPDPNTRGIEVAGFLGGITNGMIGAWGPVVTPALMHRKVEPRIAIGSGNTAEIAVALAASGSLLASVGGGGIDAGTVIAMLTGGVIAAPVAAYVVRHLKPRMLGIGAGAMLLTTNIRELAKWADIGTARWIGYVAVLTVVTYLLAQPHLTNRRTRTDSATIPA